MINKVELSKVQFEGIDKAVIQIVHNEEVHNIGLTGTLSILVLQFLKGECPLGIVIDRLEEEPLEFGTHSSSIVPQVVACLHRNYPDSLSYVLEKE